MTGSNQLKDSLRNDIIAQPDMILDDKDVMNALIAANEAGMGNNIVDLRGIAMERLEARLDRLEDTHRSVIAAAYDNLAGTNQVHRAILRMLDPVSFEPFLRDLDGPVADILNVSAVRLVLESSQPDGAAISARLGSVLFTAEPGFVARYLDDPAEAAGRTVTLRPLRGGLPGIYGDTAGRLRSEACIRLDLGPGRLPGLLLMGSDDDQQFTPQQGTDLLAFFGGVFERSMRRWLS